MSYVICYDEAREGDPLGGKGRALRQLGDAGFPIPPWVVVAPAAADAARAGARPDHTLRDSPEAIAPTFESLTLPPQIAAELDSALRRIADGEARFAVRSSALDEDSVHHSYAGQLESYLFVAARDVPARIADVWRSAFSERVFAYRREHKLDGLPTPPAVIVQAMVDADVSGVAFSADPVSGRRTVAVVASLYGLGTALVSGEADSDTHHVDGNGTIVKQIIANKNIAHRFSDDAAEGVATIPVPDAQAREPALSAEQVSAVASLARRAAEVARRPQDIEWAIAGGELYLLQSRPITSLGEMADPEGTLRIWDNSNIAESYGGITTPLTFTFARRAYEGVYRQFCRILRVPRKTVEDSSAIFENMLGLIRGRIYYNLLNWYRILAMLPGYQINRGFMEQMMGVREGIPDDALGPAPKVGWWMKFVDGLRVVGTVAGLVANYVVLGRRIRSFYRRLDDALSARESELARLRSDELASSYRELETRLITRWDAPLVNDFFAMIFYGILRRLCVRWCGDEQGTLQNDLLCGTGGMISTEPAVRVQEMAAIASARPPLAQTLCTAELPEAMREIGRHADFSAKLDEYLVKFGERCSDELKLESPTLRDDPLMLLRAVGGLAVREPQPLPNEPSTARDVGIRIKAEDRVNDAITGRLRRRVFNWVLRNTRARVKDRENLRFERTRVFGRVRAIFAEMGRRLQALGLLDEHRDVYYLEIGEILGFAEGTATSTNLRSLARLRKTEFDHYRGMEPPDDRFETRGLVHQGNPFRSGDVRVEGSGDERRGIGCCPGIVSGRVRVVRDPREARLRRGNILVAERTDPSWIMLFPFAAGILVERGSLLSHAAIVAREMSIPAIVSIEGVTRWLTDDDWVEMDGSTGAVRRVESPIKEPSVVE